MGIRKPHIWGPEACDLRVAYVLPGGRPGVILACSRIPGKSGDRTPRRPRQYRRSLGAAPILDQVRVQLSRLVHGGPLRLGP